MKYNFNFNELVNMSMLEQEKYILSLGKDRSAGDRRKATAHAEQRKLRKLIVEAGFDEELIGSKKEVHKYLHKWYTGTGWEGKNGNNGRKEHRHHRAEDTLPYFDGVGEEAYFAAKKFGMVGKPNWEYGVANLLGDGNSFTSYPCTSVLDGVEREDIIFYELDDELWEEGAICGYILF